MNLKIKNPSVDLMTARPLTNIKAETYLKFILNQNLWLKILVIIGCLFFLVSVYRIGANKLYLWDFAVYYAPVALAVTFLGFLSPVPD